MNKLPLSRRRFLQLVGLGFAWFASMGKGCAAKADVKSVTTKPKVVVIGAGLGGLCCAAHLARAGFPVTVVEQHSVPGGYASSFTRGRFNFEVSLHATSLADHAAGGQLESLGIRERIELVELPALYRLKTADLDITVPEKDPDEFIKRLTQHFPAEKEGITEFIHDLVKLAEVVHNLERYRHSVFKLLMSLPYLTLWRIRNKTLARWLDSYTQDPGAREVLAALWGYFGLPPSRLSAFYFAVGTGGFLRDGAYYIRPRSQSLSTVLAEVIQEAGGKIQYGTAVEKIHIRNGAVEGISLTHGTQLPAQVVVSNANALDTFNRMLPAGTVSTEYKNKLAEYRPSISSFIVWLGLNRDITDLVENYNNHFSSGRGPEADYQSCLEGDVEHGSFIVMLYDKLYKGYSRPGASTVQILFLSGFEPWRRFEEDYRAGHKQAYDEQKNRWAEVLIRRAEQNIVPGLSSMIEVREAATPLTNWRFTRNLQGAIYGFEQATNNTFYKRIQNRTPVNGLYLASAWGNPGAGYSAVLAAGQMAYQDIVSDWVKA